MEKKSVSCSPSVGVAKAVEGENWGGSAEQRHAPQSLLNRNCQTYELIKYAYTRAHL